MRPLVLGTLLVAGACTTAVKAPQPASSVRRLKVTKHKFAPTHIVGRPIPTLSKSEARPMPDPLGGLSAAALYELATRAQEEARWTKALSIWDRLLAEHPSAVQRVFALLGSATSLQQLGRCAEALPRFEEAVDMLDPEEDAEDYVDARFAMGSCYAEKRQYDEVIDLFSALLENFAMPSEMRIASLVSLGVGLFMNGELEDARRRFQAGIDEHNLKSQSEYLDDRYYMGQAHFYMGELARTDFRKVDLAAATTSEAMAKLLDDKCNHLLDAQMSYVRAIKTRHFGWASAAAHQVGTMYEGLYAHMQDLPRPSDLTELETLEYKRELTKKVAVLLRKAIKTWTSALEFAARTGTDNIWVRETKKKLARVEKLYFDEYLDPQIEARLDQASDEEAEAEQVAAKAEKGEAEQPPPAPEPTP